MSANNDIQRQLEAGIAAARRGDHEAAQRLLEAVIRQDENNELAWIWLASSVKTRDERRICLQKVLEINPNNQRAREALRLMGGAAGGTPPPAAGGQRAGQAGDRPGLDWGAVGLRVLVVVGVIGGLVLLSLLIFPAPVQAPAPQVTSPGAVAQPATRTPTPVLSPTFPGVRATARTVPTLPPTFTPTFTPTPSVTPPPTPTPFALSEFTILAAARPLDEPLPSLYRGTGAGDDFARVAENVRDITYDRTGSQVAFVREIPRADDPEGGVTVGEIFVAPADDLAQARQVSDLRIASGEDPTFSPSGEQVVFASDFDGDAEIWLYDPATGITSQLTDNESTDRAPHWSPDGERLVFSSDRVSPGLPDLYVLTFDTGGAGEDPESGSGYEISPLLDVPGGSYESRWSPDGAWIVYVNDRAGSGDLWMVGRDGQRNRQLTSGPADDRSPAWTPDGERILFSSNREGERFQIYALDLLTDEITQVTAEEWEVQSVAVRPEVRFRIRTQP